MPTPIRAMRKKITNVDGGTEESSTSRNEKRYRQGTMPVLHKVFFEAIIKALNGEKSGIFVIQEFGPSVGISRGGAHRILKALEENGYIKLIPNKRRNAGTEIEVLRGFEKERLNS